MFHTNSSSPCWITNSYTDSCMPFSPSFAHSNWRLLVRQHAHPGKQRCDGARPRPREGAQQPTESTLKLWNTTCYFKAYFRSFTYRFTAGDSSSSCLWERHKSMRRAASLHFLQWKQHLPEKHLSRCHEKRLVRTRCVIGQTARMCKRTDWFELHLSSEPWHREYWKISSFKTCFSPQRKSSKMSF